MGEHVNANGVHTHFDVHGAGEPLALLHGGMSTADVAAGWSGHDPALSGRYRVYMPERRGHGHTPDLDGPITYTVMADDTVAFLEAVGTGRAHLVGWSDGAVVAALVALRRPELVGRLVLIGQYFTLEGLRPEARQQFFDQLEFSGEAAPTVSDKMVRLWRSEPNIQLAELARIDAPTLVMQGDEDFVTVEHSAAVAGSIPDAQLAVLPGATHAAPLEKPGLVNQTILDFLGGEQPEKLIPLRGHER